MIILIGADVVVTGLERGLMVTGTWLQEGDTCDTFLSGGGDGRRDLTGAGLLSMTHLLGSSLDAIMLGVMLTRLQGAPRWVVTMALLTCGIENVWLIGMPVAMATLFGGGVRGGVSTP